MTPEQRKRALEGLQERIDKIVQKYQAEKDQIYNGDRVTKKHKHALQK